MKRRLLAVLAAVLILGLIAAVAIGPKAWRWYQNQQREPLVADSVITPTVAGQTTYIAANDQPGPRRLMLFAHGHSGRHDALTLVRVTEWAQELVDDGWIVAASDAHGDVWGSPEERADYVALYERVAEEYDVTQTVFVAESMGAIGSLHVVADDSIPTLVAWVGVSPVVDTALAVDSAELGETIANEADPADVAEWSPDDLPIEAFEGVALRIAVATDDDTVPPETGEAFAEKYGAEISTCDGGHVAENCYDDLDIEALVG